MMTKNLVLLKKRLMQVPSGVGLINLRVGISGTVYQSSKNNIEMSSSKFFNWVLYSPSHKGFLKNVEGFVHFDNGLENAKLFSSLDEANIKKDLLIQAVPDVGPLKVTTKL